MRMAQQRRDVAFDAAFEFTPPAIIAFEFATSLVIRATTY
jgi:hypothetical protein